MGQQTIQTDRRAVQVPASFDALRASAEAFSAAQARAAALIFGDLDLSGRQPCNCCGALAEAVELNSAGTCADCAAPEGC